MKSLLFVTAMTLCAFPSFSQFDEDESVKKKIRYTQINNDDLGYYATATFPIPCLDLNNTAFLFDLGADASFFRVGTGQLDVLYNRNIFLTEVTKDPGFYPVDDVDKNEFKGVASIVFFKKYSDGSTGRYLETESPDPRSVRRYAVRLGYDQDFMREPAENFAKMMYEKNGYDIQFDQTYGTNSSGWMDQSVKSIRFGLSTQKMFNTNVKTRFNAKESRFNSSSSTTNLYVDCNYWLSSVSSKIEYRIRANSYSPYHTFIADPLEYSTVRKFGFLFGLEHLWFSPGRIFSSTKIKFEVGSRAGYHDKIVYSMFFNLSFIRLGIGGFAKTR